VNAGRYRELLSSRVGEVRPDAAWWWGEGEGRPRVVVPFSSVGSATKIAAAASAGVDVAELRVDRFGTRDVADIVADAEAVVALPLVATIRHADEGGEWGGSDADRAALYDALVPVVAAIDVEIRSAIAAEVIATARDDGALTIASFHDFRGTPPLDELRSIGAKSQALGADLCKVAAHADTIDDFRTLAQFTIDHADDGVAVLAMGRFGPPSRVLFGALGSKLTYAHDGTHALPGQLSYVETLDLLEQLTPR
jgi:3-dehydroquinate dehydratase I